MALRVAALLIALGIAVAPVHAQNGYWSAQYGKTMQYSATPYTVNVNGADTWPLNTPVSYVLASSACSKYYLILNKLSSFFTATVINPNVCNMPSSICTGPAWNQAGCQTGTSAGWASYANVYPFQLEWYDTSTTAVFVLPTRQNVPSGMTPESSTFVISQALASNMATASMRLQLTILPRQTNLFTITIYGWYYGIPYSASSPSVWKVTDYSYLFPSMGASGRMGLQYISTSQYDTGSTYWMYNAFRRKQPTPAFYFKFQWGSGCWWGNYAGGSINNCGWYNRRYYYGSGRNDWHTELVTCGGDCTDWYIGTTSSGTASYLAWEFYEDVRTQSNNITIAFATIAQTVMQASNKYSMVVKTDGNISFPLRFSWTNLTDETDCCTASAIRTAQRRFIGVFVIPPFAIQDAWITVHDENGNRVFTEVEKRVPYRGAPGGDGTGQPGWHLALSNRTWASKTMTIKLRWNRRNLIGSREEETRASQLVSFVTDNGGWVAGLTTPIPLTLISGSGVMGVVTNQAFAAGQVLGNISYQSCITGNMTALLWAHKLRFKLNASKAFNTYWVNSTEAYVQEQIMMTVMLTAGLPSELDESTTYWTVADAMYPAAPNMLPHFWDGSMVSRLLGFSEIPTFCAYQLGNWTFEYNQIAAQWPWFGLEVTAAQYTGMRAHVRRGLLTSPAGEAFLPAFVHLMRHSTTSPPNTNINIEWSTKMVTLVASSAMAYQTELIPNFSPALYYKHEYFLRYGAVSPLAMDSATVPNYDGYLDYTSLSRQTMVWRWTTMLGQTYKQALATAISVMSQKLANLPVTVNGLGATSDQVQMATALLQAERSVLTFQIADGNLEYAFLP